MLNFYFLVKKKYLLNGIVVPFVYQLKKNQDTTGIGMKNFSNTYRALDDYDVEKIYVEQESLALRGLTADDLIIEVEVISTEKLSAIMAQQDVVISS